MLITCKQCIVYAICKNKRRSAITCSILFDNLMSGDFMKKIEETAEIFRRKMPQFKVGSMLIYRDIMHDDHIIYVERPGRRSVDVACTDIPNILKIKDEAIAQYIHVFNVSEYGFNLEWS